jgi:23S rRNA (cytidine1920-2'-O)/16S rRNA (cytidine1409-2'-O)-methyltransferase
MAKKVRADELLVNSQLVESRSKAQACILAGQVTYKGEKILKSSQLLPLEATLTLENPMPYVGRGGLKMENFLKETTWNLKGVHFLDLGASTGGFTDCLLQKGAASATCVDVGRGQLHYKLRIDERVTNIEKMNLKALEPHDLPFPHYSLVVMDLSFISLRQVLPQAWQFVENQGHLVSLVKPQFECEKKEADLGRGVIKDTQIHQRVLQSTKDLAEQKLLGSHLNIETTAKPQGGDGNTEFFLCWQKCLPG